MIKIGSVVGNRTVTAMTRQFVLAVSIDTTVPEPWTVWDLDSDGNGVHNGRYFKEQMDAEWDFCSRAFEWFQDNVNINYIEDEEEPEEPPVPTEKKSFINKDFDEAVDKMVEELNERKGKENAPETAVPEQEDMKLVVKLGYVSSEDWETVREALKRTNSLVRRIRGNNL